MKKIGIYLLVVVMLATTVACSSKKGSKNNRKTLYEKGLELIDQLDMIAESKEYISIYSATDSLATIAQDIGSQDYSKPKKVFKIDGLETATLDTILNQGKIELDPKIKKVVQGRFSSTFANLINNNNGAEFLAVSSMISVGDSFLYEGLKEQVSYIYVFDHKYSCMVTFLPYEDNIVGTTASIIQSDSFTADTKEEDMLEYFTNQLMFVNDDVVTKNLKITEVTK